MLYISKLIKDDPYVNMLEDFDLIKRDLDSVTTAFHADLMVLHIEDTDRRFLKIISGFKIRNPHLKVIVISDVSDSGFLIELINMGVDRFVDKNRHNREIAEVVECLACDILQLEHTEYTKQYNKSIFELMYETFLFMKLDISGKILEINSLFCELLGVDSDALIGSDFRDIVDNKIWNFLEKDVYSRLMMGDLYRGTLSIVGFDGEIFIDCTAYAIENSITNTKEIVYIARDVSESNKLFLQSLSNLLDNEDTLTILFDNNLEPIMVNSKYLDLAGSLSQDEFFSTCTLWDWHTYNTHLEDIDYGGTRADMLSSFMKNAKYKNSKEIISVAEINGNRRYYTTHVSTIANPIVSFEWYYILYFIDVTEQELAKIQAIESAKLMSIGQLSAAITHEINTPLTYIKGNLELLQFDCDNDESKEQFDEIFGGIKRIESIIDSMYEFSGNCKKDKQICDVSKTILNAVKLVQNRAKHISKIYVNSVLFGSQLLDTNGKYLIECKSDRLEQVWIIIINNALDELEKGFLEYNERRIFINCYGDDESVHITIRDNGGGVILDEPRDIFKFGTGGDKQKSMGVGLNVAEVIVKAHGGTIDVYNDSVGAIFEIKLKLYKEDEHVV